MHRDQDDQIRPPLWHSSCESLSSRKSNTSTVPHPPTASCNHRRIEPRRYISSKRSLKLPGSLPRTFRIFAGPIMMTGHSAVSEFPLPTRRMNLQHLIFLRKQATRAFVTTNVARARGERSICKRLKKNGENASSSVSKPPRRCKPRLDTYLQKMLVCVHF